MKKQYLLPAGTVLAAAVLSLVAALPAMAADAVVPGSTRPVPAPAAIASTGARVQPAVAETRAVPVRFLVAAAQETILSAPVSGRIARLAVGLGDGVRAGQVVAAFDCAEVQARRGAAQAELEAARVQHEAKLKLQGLQSAAEVEVELAAANVNKAESQVRIADAQQAQCNFVAPFNGKVARVHVKVGQGVSPGAPVIELVSAGRPKARLNVPSQWLAWLKVGKVLDAVVDETGAPATLKVTRMAGRVDAVSQTIEIEADVDGGGAVLPGMSGQVRAPMP